MTNTLFDVTPGGFAILDDLANDPGVLAHMRRQAVVTAIRLAALADGTFHAGTMRPHLPKPPYDVNPHSVGAVVSALVKTGAIRKTGRYAESGNVKNRNGQRPVPIYRIVNLGGLA